MQPRRPAYTPPSRIFSPTELLPAQWRDLAPGGALRFFNPAILADAPGYIMAYRAVLPDGLRRLAICRLDSALAVVPGSHVPLSDLLSLPPGIDYPSQAKTWFADPRLIHWGNRILVHWNSGCHEPANHQFVQELDPRTLAPLAASSELLLSAERVRFEKNWGLFPSGNQLYAVYSLAPLRILQLAPANHGTMQATEVHRRFWKHRRYTKRFGEMRGGAPPVLAGGRYYAVYHSSYRTPAGSRYVAGCLAFSSQPPFGPEAFTGQPLPLPNPFGGEFLHERLNSTVAEVIYPCGAICEGDRWLISYGINDEHVAIAAFDTVDMTRQLCPASGSSGLWWTIARRLTARSV